MTQPIVTLIGCINAQYGAVLSMLRGCVEGADATVWNGSLVGQFPFWHVAYHTLWNTDHYLSPNENEFEAQPFHREGYHLLGQSAWEPDAAYVAPHLPYDKDELMAYLDACWAKAKLTMAAETEESLAAPSGFSWLEFTRLELHLYNIRHIQHHTGQFAALLRREKGEGIAWIDSQPL